MADITTRNQFKDYCMRELGYPVIQINVDDEQIEDRIDEALKYCRDYHHDFTEHVYYKHIVTQEDKDRGWISLPEAMIGVIKIFPISNSFSSNNMFNLRYQMTLNDLYTWTGVSMVPYVVAMRHIELLEEILVGYPLMRFNKHTDRLYVDMDWSQAAVGAYMLVEGYSYLDPNEYTDLWSDRFLASYTCALIKRQWGTNLKKFDGIQMPGNVTFNGQKIFDEAIDEIKELKAELMSSTLPPADEIG